MPLNYSYPFCDEVDESLELSLADAFESAAPSPIMFFSAFFPKDDPPPLSVLAFACDFAGSGDGASSYC